MSSQARQRQPLRAVAEDVLRNVSRGFVNPKRETDWVAAIARQWVSYGGHAVVLTPTDCFWVQTIRHEKGYTVHVTHNPGSPVQEFVKDWKIKSDLVPQILGDLNLLQVSEFKNRVGQKLRLRVDPQEHRLSIEPA